MPDTNLPAVGKVPRKGLVIGMLVAAAGGVYIWWRHKESAAATASSATPAAYAYGYGSYGYGAQGQLTPEELASEEGLEPYGYGGVYGYGAGGAGVGVGSPYPVTAPVVPVTTNAEWAQAAETELGNSGYDSTTSAAALGKYITGGAVTADQQSIIQSAIAFEGYPPQPGANNYPPNINTGPATGQSGGGGAATKTVTANGKQSLNAIAKANGISESKLISLNPTNVKLIAQTYGTGKPVKAGSKWKV
jgi:LysM repeat protein